MKPWHIVRAVPTLPALCLLLGLAPLSAWAQSAEETVLFLLIGDTQAPKANGRFAIDSKGETTVFLGGHADGRNTQVVFHTLWRLQPLDACRYRLFRL